MGGYRAKCVVLEPNVWQWSQMCGYGAKCVASSQPKNMHAKEKQAKNWLLWPIVPAFKEALCAAFP